ncbi:MAG: hypothetical protein ACYTBS_17850 [Planctomycetota bacterium]|jgi:hypothetical protein
MTRKRNLKKMMSTPPAVQQAHAAQMNNLAEMLSAEQTGNFGVMYPDGRPNISQVRNLEREMVSRFNDPRVMLPNPTADAPFDRTEPLDRIAKNEALGFQVQPDRIIDLPPGDAGAGKSVYRRTHVFARLNASTAPEAPVAGNPYDKAIGMATYVSSDCRPRFWHISFFGIGVQRVANNNALLPLSNDEILSEQLEPITNNIFPTRRFIPAISQMKGRIMAFDESGQRFYDVDVMGNRSLDIYAWGVTAFILAPGNFYEGRPEQAAYEVSTQNGGLPTPQTAFEGLVEDSIIGVRIVPIVINSTQNTENRTITVVTPARPEDTRIPIPPGTLRVQVICHEDPTIAATYTIRFDAGDDGTFLGRSDLGIIDINPGIIFVVEAQ